MKTTSMDLSRTIIIGNSGSGKSWLAERIATRLSASYVDLDLIHWLPGGYNVARERDDAIRLVRQAARADRWVIEGIYSSLVKEVQSDATALLWLCPDAAECISNIRERGIRRNGSPESFAALLDWAATYRSRNGSSSYIGHEATFNGYLGDKKILRSRDAVTEFARRLGA
jgi:adenylate kinase family enzyme